MANCPATICGKFVTAGIIFIVGSMSITQYQKREKKI